MSSTTAISQRAQPEEGWRGASHWGSSTQESERGEFAAFSRDVARFVCGEGEAPVLDEARRARLVSFAESVVVERGRRRGATARSKGFGLLQAVFVANALAALDAPAASNPFERSELATAYEQQRRILAPLYTSA